MNNMGYVLEINNLTKKYPAFELKPVSFHIEAGEVMGFIGRNGAGKTTTLKSILNLVHPDAGSVRILGMNYLDNEAYRHYLTGFKLDENKKIMELSEGMKVKFYLTLALSHHAKLLILDEPTSGLDPVSRDEMNEIFRKLAEKGVAILFSTHITSDLEKCADTITYIKNGELLLSAKKEDFIRHYTEEIGGAPTLEDIMVHIEREEVNL